MHDEYCYCVECLQRAEQKKADDRLFDEALRISGWPEDGNRSLDVEALYGAFKRRLMRELAAEKRRDIGTDFTEWAQYPLVERE